MKRPLRSDKPLFRSWVLSYLLVLLPMLLMCHMLYQSNVGALESSMRDLQQHKANQYRMSLEGQLSDIKLLANQLYTNAYNEALTARAQADLKSTDFTCMSKMRQSLNTAIHSMGGIKEVLFHVARSDYGITSKRVLQMEELYAMTDESEALWGSPEQMRALLGCRQEGLLLHGDTGKLYYAATMPNRSSVLFSLSLEYYIGLYSLATDAEEFFALVGDDLIYQNADSFPVDVSDLAAVAQREDPEYLVTVARLEGWNYTIVSAISRTDLNAALLARTTSLLVMLPFCVLVCFLLILYSVRRHYNPVADLLRLANEKGLSTCEKRHEYEQLNALLQKALENRQKLEASEDQSRRRRDNARLLQALATPQAERLVADCFARAGKAFAHPYWCYVEMTLVDYSALREADPGEEPLLAIARQLALEMLEQSVDALAANDSRRLLFLVGLSDNQDAQNLTLRSDLQKALGFLHDEYSAEFQCFMTEILPVEEDFSRLSARLMEELAEMRQMPGVDTSPIQFYRRLSPSARSALATLNALAQCAVDHNASGLQFGAKALLQLSEEWQREGAKEKADAAGDNTLEAQVVQLVKSSYFDPNLNVSAIAQRLGRNPDVVSRVFRQAMNVGPLEYIHSVRVNAAIELLKGNPDMTAQRAAELCGYVNIDTFQRAFKRVTGTTPGKYREAGGDAQAN